MRRLIVNSVATIAIFVGSFFALSDVSYANVTHKCCAGSGGCCYCNGCGADAESCWCPGAN